MHVKHPIRLMVLTLTLMTTCFAQMLFDDSHKITQSFKENSLWKGIDPVELFNTMSMNRTNAKRLFAQKVLPVVRLNVSNIVKQHIPTRIIVDYASSVNEHQTKNEASSLKLFEQPVLQESKLV